MGVNGVLFKVTGSRAFGPHRASIKCAACPMCAFERVGMADDRGTPAHAARLIIIWKLGPGLPPWIGRQCEGGNCAPRSPAAGATVAMAGMPADR